MGAVLNSNSSYITFVHNTLWHNGTSTSPGNLSYCKKPPVTDTVIKNNIISDSLGDFDVSINCSVISDFNNFYNIKELSVKWLGQSLNWVDYVNVSGQDQHSLTDNPFFNPSEGDFSLSEESVNIDSGSALTKTTSEGSGIVVPVVDALYFSDGFGLMEGDKIRIGNQLVVVIMAFDYQRNIIRVDHQISWNKDETVSYDFSGASPDRGAKEAALSVQGSISFFSSDRLERLFIARLFQR
jgi:hypothetical protein